MLNSIEDAEKWLNNESDKQLTNRLQIAPMVDVTHQKFRLFFRLISKRATLYTEMIHTKTILDENKREFY